MGLFARADRLAVIVGMLVACDLLFGWVGLGVWFACICVLVFLTCCYLIMMVASDCLICCLRWCCLWQLFGCTIGLGVMCIFGWCVNGLLVGCLGCCDFIAVTNDYFCFLVCWELLLVYVLVVLGC